MKKHYDIGNGTLSRLVIEKALTRLAQLLNEKNKRVELVAAGGVISVMVFESRQMTRDIDVIISPKDRALIVELVDAVAKKQSLPGGSSYLKPRLVK
jgi:predicted nucleotidyltransferase